MKVNVYYDDQEEDITGGAYSTLELNIYLGVQKDAYKQIERTIHEILENRIPCIPHNVLEILVEEMMDGLIQTDVWKSFVHNSTTSPPQPQCD